MRAGAGMVGPPLDDKVVLASSSGHHQDTHPGRTYDGQPTTIDTR
jgi:hypothetical protein